MLRKTKQQYKVSVRVQLLLVSLFIPIIASLYTFLLLSFQQLRDLPTVDVVTHAAEPAVVAVQTFGFDIEIPPKHIATYIDAATAYDIPWTLLAAHHRVETRFSTAQTDMSPAGAEGPFQFMPCTFVGWEHPTCSGKGKGNIPVAEKTSVATIEKYGGYGVDGDGDGVANPLHFVDAAYSAAHYLASSGAQDGQYEKAIYTYNHSSRYVDDVLHYFTQYERHRHALEAYAQQF